jgi:hypothetical protein
MTSAERDGQIVVVAAIASVFVWLLLSTGYSGQAGPLTSFYHTMHVVDMQLDFSIGGERPFCSKVTKPYSPGSILTREIEECSFIRIKTRYLVLLSLLIASYGILILKSLVPTPFPYLARLIRGQKLKSMTEDS